MIGILTKKDGEIIEKRVHFGETENVIEKVNAEAARLGQTIEIFEEGNENWPEFEAVEIQKKENSDWAKAKQQGIAESISFLAKRLGLE